ncbi:MAG: alpha/beta hydrolase [Verrucomicrobia bacterium]|nr:alpha/beta hydrolase [Verrucomicrobiota bacterium]
MKQSTRRIKPIFFTCLTVLFLGIALFKDWYKTPLLVVRVLFSNDVRFSTTWLERKLTTRTQIGWTKLRAQPFDATANDGTLLKCLFVTNSLPKARGTVLVLHGLGGNKENELWLARDLFSTNGFNTIFFDSRAHGESGGRFCTLGVKEAPDIGIIIKAAEKKFGSLGNIGIFGPSLGSATTIQAIPITPRLKCAVIFSPFSKSSEVLNDWKMKWMKELQQKRMRSDDADIDSVDLLEKAPLVTIPILLAHGEKDTMMPIEQGRMVFAKLGSVDKRFLPIPQAGHEDMWNTDAPVHDGKTLREIVVQFFVDHLGDR